MLNNASVSKNRAGAVVVIVVSLLLTFVADQAAKTWALENLTYRQSSAFLPGFLKLTLTHNTGAAFSVGRDYGSLMGIMAGVLTLVIVIWAIKRIKSDQPPILPEQVGIGFLIGGACGNLFDRVIRGRVTDFLEFDFMDFPVFNVADAMIDVGIGLIIIAMLVVSRAEKAQRRDDGETTTAQ